MKHRMMGVLTWDKDQEWKVNLFDGKIRNAFKDKDEAVKFVEDELLRVIDDYDFELCYRVENLVMNRRSYVLLSKDKKGKVLHTSLSRYEYAKTHFFFYSKDKRRRIIDYRNPSFPAITRSCISTPHKLSVLFLTCMAASAVVLSALLALFIGATNNDLVQAVEATQPEASNHGAMIAMLSIALASTVFLFIIYTVRYARYSQLVKSGSSWNESYSTVDWRQYYKFVKFTRMFATLFSVAFVGTIVAFGVIFTQSSMFDALSKVPEVKEVMIVFIMAAGSSFSVGVITTYYVIRFRINLRSIAPVVMTEQGIEMYNQWLKGEDFTEKQLEAAFHPVEEHLLYAFADIKNENPKFANLSDMQLKELRKDINDYRKLILADKFGKHPVDPAVLAEAKQRYSQW